ncbi:MAG: hypothetical protein ACJ8EK_13585, partial [Bradyrhizobium sp.]
MAAVATNAIRIFLNMQTSLVQEHFKAKRQKVSLVARRDRLSSWQTRTQAMKPRATRPISAGKKLENRNCCA